MNRYTLLLLIGLSFVSTEKLFAQELKATVDITVPKLQVADPSLFKTMKADLEDFLNNQRFTNDEFEEHERIQCTFQMNITSELEDNYFTADVAIQSLRPVYNSEYKTPLITHADRGLTFQYVQFQQIVDSRNSYQDNLSAIFTFYAYWILGMDYDSFEKNGGEEHFKTMQNVLASIPPAVKDSDKGWASTGRKNTRYWLTENLLNPRMSTFREAMYQYHIQSLDIMYKDPELAMNNMMTTLKTLGTTNRSYPNSAVMIVFGNAKTEEIVEIFKQGSRQQKAEVKGILRNINPSSAEKYAELN